MTQFSQEELRRESNRFHMYCRYCGQAAVPQLMPFDVVELVRVFIREHHACKAARG